MRQLKGELKTYISGDEEHVCLCNYDLSPLIIDVDLEVVYCSICGHSNMLPSYLDLLPESSLYEYYNNPKKKVYDWGKKDLNVPANVAVMNFVRAHIGV